MSDGSPTGYTAVPRLNHIPVGVEDFVQLASLRKVQANNPQKLRDTLVVTLLLNGHGGEL